jgi:L,D-transpeptidase catalytic domain
VRVLSARVRKRSSAQGLRVALEAYYRYRAAHPDLVRKPYLYYVDLGLDNRTPRGYVFDMDKLAVVDGPFTVAHGAGSSATRDAVPTVFSNRTGSHASSLGLYLAEGTYAFVGRSGGKLYRSVGLRLRGESGRFNDAAEARGIVVHGAHYVTSAGAGRSEGCPAMEPSRAQRLLPLLANGGVVFVYSPNDATWLKRGPWVSGAAAE